jgi:hypothetical protein
MLFSLHENLDDRLVRLIALKPGIAAIELAQHISGPKKQNIHAVYKQLRKLVRIGVVVKQSKKHFLRAHWINNFRDFESRVSRTYGHGLCNTDLLPSVGKEYRLSFSNMYLLNDYSSNLLLAMCQVCDSDTSYAWHPHSWFWLLQPDKEDSHWRQMISEGVSRTLIVGGDTPLDRHIARLWSKQKVVYRLDPQSDKWSRDTYIVTAHPFILKLKIDKDSVHYIDQLFASSAKDGRVNAQLFNRAFNSKWPSLRLSLENNSRRCQQIEKYFRNYFGVTR